MHWVHCSDWREPPNAPEYWDTICRLVCSNRLSSINIGERSVSFELHWNEILLPFERGNTEMFRKLEFLKWSEFNTQEEHGNNRSIKQKKWTLSQHNYAKKWFKLPILYFCILGEQYWQFLVAAGCWRSQLLIWFWSKLDSLPRATIYSLISLIFEKK